MTQNYTIPTSGNESIEQQQRGDTCPTQPSTFKLLLLASAIGALNSFHARIRDLRVPAASQTQKEGTMFCTLSSTHALTACSFRSPLRSVVITTTRPSICLFWCTNWCVPVDQGFPPIQLALIHRYVSVSLLQLRDVGHQDCLVNRFPLSA
jgi:hypothetical protein